MSKKCEKHNIPLLAVNPISKEETKYICIECIKEYYSKQEPKQRRGCVICD